MKLKLLKFDVIHPVEYLQKKKEEWEDLNELSLKEYRQRLIELRSNYSDFYTHHLNQSGNWEAEEYFLLDDDFTEKAARELFKATYKIQKFKKGRSRSKLHHLEAKWKLAVIDAYIEKFQPDVIFVRSQPVSSKFWQKYRKNTLLVSRLSARLPHNWHPNHWDLIYTDQPDFKTFFDLHGVPTLINDQGFDKRIVAELKKDEKKYETIFVGGLGTENFLKRTEFINTIAQKIDFKWWGYWWRFGSDGRGIEDFPALKKTFQGLTSGLEMFQKYRDSKIVVNDYVDTANGIGFNQRMFEVMGCGAFMLTREAPNFKEHFPENLFATYTDEQDFLEKRNYYLQNEKEREQIAQNAQKFIEDNFDYTRISAEFQRDLERHLKMKNT